MIILNKYIYNNVPLISIKVFIEKHYSFVKPIMIDMFPSVCKHMDVLLLQDFYGQAEPIPDHHEISLSIISLIGLSLSILGLSLTIISYAFFK